MRSFPFLAFVVLTGCPIDPPTDAPSLGDTASGDTDGDGRTGADDCGEGDPTIYAGAPERCNGVDDDCDGTVDEDATDAETWYADTDGDGYGAAGVTETACELPTGFVSTATDCDDGEQEYHPDAAETCNGADDNCDGAVDEGLTTTLYSDLDGDGYGSPEAPFASCTSTATGYVVDATDCDDTSATNNPAGIEVCDGRDNDCDGTVDGASAIDPSTWYYDDDGDGYGDAGATELACTPSAGFVSDDTDCDDTDPGQPDTRGLCAVPYTTTWGSYMLVISPGTYTMGGGLGDPAREYTDHDVTLTRTFWLGEHEVTQFEWAGWTDAPDPAPSYSTGADHPVENISWEDAALYANALSTAEGLMPCYTPTGSEMADAYVSDPYACPGYRFPAEAEWEYAARAGENTMYAGSNAFDDVAWHAGTSGWPWETATHEVCGLDPNAWGLCDMSGNVREYTNDWYGPTYGGYGTGGRSTDPIGASSGTWRTVRGGSAYQGTAWLFVAYRDDDPWSVGDGYRSTGFRLARSSLSP